MNLLGAVHGAYAVLPHFLDRGRGTLINTVSMGGLAPTPFAAAYTASKFGLRGFPTDVTEPEAVDALARAALRAFGGIDVWINNAGVGVFGPLLDAPLDLHRQTIAVNLLGAVHGAYAVLPHFLDRGRGTLINTVSMGG
ncbi:hypothetical protein CTI14_41580, partial [Methylobacterium radiotolerans]